MSWRVAVVLIAASAILPVMAAAQSKTATRIAELRAFTGLFWQTMPVRVSSACRGVVNDTLHTLAEQYIVRGSDVSYYGVVQQTRIAISLTQVLNDLSVMSNLEWAECRELVLLGLNDRQITRHEADAKAEQERREAVAKAEKQRKEEARRRKKAAEDARWEAAKAECDARMGILSNNRNPTCSSRFSSTAEYQAYLREREREEQARTEQRREKERQNAEALQRMREEAERQQQERERAKVEKRRKLDERRRQLSGGG